MRFLLLATLLGLALLTLAPPAEALERLHSYYELRDDTEALAAQYPEIAVYSEHGSSSGPLGLAIFSVDVALNITTLSEAELAEEEDWAAEYLAPVLAIRIVENIDDAIAHVRRWGSDHTDIIVTNDYRNSQAWLRRVNSSTVGVNCSTAFADGFRLGLGAEIGISTSKLHAFGPMGLEELTSRKFVLTGDGQIRE